MGSLGTKPNTSPSLVVKNDDPVVKVSAVFRSLYVSVLRDFL